MKIVRKQKKDLQFAIYFLVLFIGICYAALVIFLPKFSIMDPTFWGILLFSALCCVPPLYGTIRFFKIYFKGYKERETIDDWAKYRWN